jgi:hypothetical protein
MAFLLITRKTLTARNAPALWISRFSELSSVAERRQTTAMPIPTNAAA